jgi:hypothetical protein
MFHMPCNAEIQTSPESFKRTFQIYASGGGHQYIYVMFRTKHTKDTLKLKQNFLDIYDDGDDVHEMTKRTASSILSSISLL